MIITWIIVDGYIYNVSRELEINDDDLAVRDTIEEKKEYVRECVQEAFRSEVSWEITDYGGLE